MKDPNRTSRYIYHTDQRAPLLRTPALRHPRLPIAITIIGLVIVVILGVLL